MMNTKYVLALCLTILLQPIICSKAQQQYSANAPLACAVNGTTTLGYTCNSTASSQPSCSTYLVFRSDAPYYQTPLSISFLLNATSANVSSANQIPVISPIPQDQLVLIPVPCACTGGQYYQHDANYTIKFASETYFSIANDTYQGLSACQALIAQNPALKATDLNVGDTMVVPLRCACPSSNQTSSGYHFLVTYLVTSGDSVSAIASRFGADTQAVLDANGLTSLSTIYPYTTLLIPLATAPNVTELTTTTSPPPPPPPSTPNAPPPSNGGGNSGNKWIYIGVGIGVGVLVLAGVIAGAFLCYHRRMRTAPDGDKKVLESSSVEYGALSEKRPSSLVSSVVRGVIESLTVYKYAELEKATGGFSEDRRIGGSSVYRGIINGDVAAIKRLIGDVSNEINILKHINHSNVVRLSGFCVHGGDTYMVYEYAENGAVSEWIHKGRKGMSFSGNGGLGWRQRVQIAYDVAEGVNYLHNYTKPPYVHKNLKSSNVLLDAEFRAKVANFGLARAVVNAEDSAQFGLQLTHNVVGTQGYLAPEYLEHGLITPQLDVFAFGVVMLELLSGKEAAFDGGDDGEKKYSTERLLWESAEGLLNGEDVRSKLKGFMDPALQGDYPFDLAYAMAELALWCVAREPRNRPAMADVLGKLSAVYNSTLDWDPSEYGNSGSTIAGR